MRLMETESHKKKPKSTQLSREARCVGCVTRLKKKKKKD